MRVISEFRDQYRFLSNFYPAPVQWDGVLYRTVEHAYQAAKTLDDKQRERIAEALGPGAAKRLGRKVALRPDWEQVKLAVMLELLRQKFREGPLRRALLGTGSAELVEGNWWGDRFWGKCRGVGENHLGRLLMRVREEVAGQATEESEQYREMSVGDERTEAG